MHIYKDIKKFLFDILKRKTKDNEIQFDDIKTKENLEMLNAKYRDKIDELELDQDYKTHIKSAWFPAIS